LAQRVQQYNVLVQEYNKTIPADNAGQPSSSSAAAGPWHQARTTTTLEAVRQQQFSWVDEYTCKAQWVDVEGVRIAVGGFDV